MGDLLRIPFKYLLREKKRYIVVEFYNPFKRITLEPNKVKYEIWNHLKNLLGERGLALANFKIIEVNGNVVIIKTNTKMVDFIRSSIPLMSKIHNQDVIPIVRGVSGTIKKAKKKFLEG